MDLLLSAIPKKSTQYLLMQPDYLIDSIIHIYISRMNIIKPLMMKGKSIQTKKRVPNRTH